MKVTVYETVAESFTLVVPPEIVAKGPDAIDDWIESERVNQSYPRAFSNVVDTHWEVTP